ncbi:MAG TPA: hypothetical protein VGE76_24275 [Opitutaceae bacterium]
MTPYERYGDEFFCQPFTMRKADGTENRCYDIGVCIRPLSDEASTLAYGWEVMRELARWTCEEFHGRPQSEFYRLVIAWSRTVRPQQGHIFKVWLDLVRLSEVASFRSPEECAARFGSGWTPFINWQKNVFFGGSNS